MIFDTYNEEIHTTGTRDEFAEYVRCLRALPDDDRDKSMADTLAHDIQRACVDLDGGEHTFYPEDFDPMSAALEKADHTDAQRFIAAIADAEAEGYA